MAIAPAVLFPVVFLFIRDEFARGVDTQIGSQRYTAAGQPCADSGCGRRLPGLRGQPRTHSSRNASRGHAPFVVPERRTVNVLRKASFILARKPGGLSGFVDRGSS